MRYDFKCNKCNHITELEMTIKQMENSKPVCEVCRSLDMQRVYTPLIRIGEKYKGNGGEGDGRSH